MMTAAQVISPAPLRVVQTSVAALATRWQRSHSEVLLRLYEFQRDGLIRFSHAGGAHERFDIEVLEPAGVTFSGMGLHR